MPEFEHAFDDRAHTFLQIGDIARLIAELHCGVEVDETTHVRWRQTMGLLREVDTLSDDSTIEPQEVIEMLTDFSVFAARYPALAPGELDEPNRRAMLERTGRILKLGEYIGESETMQRLIALRIKEARETAGYLEDAATEHVVSQPAMKEVFMPVITSLTISANLSDSIIDGRYDFQAGKLARYPDGEYYRKLIGSTLAHSGLGARAIMHVPIMREFAVMSWTRLTNRIKHGGSATSSVRIFKR